MTHHLNDKQELGWEWWGELGKLSPHGGPLPAHIVYDPLAPPGRHWEIRGTPYAIFHTRRMLERCADEVKRITTHTPGGYMV